MASDCNMWAVTNYSKAGRERNKKRKEVFKMSTRMSKKETRERIHQYSCFSSEKLANGSKDRAILPKYVETVIRCACNGERLAANDVKARKAEKSDIVMIINGKRRKIEVKCSAGAVFYAWKDGFGNALDLPDTLDNFSESDILADADYVIYTPDVFSEWLDNPEQVIKSCFVMTRQDFIGLLLATTKGKSYGLKIDRERGQVTMCNMVDKKRNKETGEVKYYPARLDRAWDYIGANNLPPVESWLKELGRL